MKKEKTLRRVPRLPMSEIVFNIPSGEWFTAFDVRDRFNKKGLFVNLNSIYVFLQALIPTGVVEIKYKPLPTSKKWVGHYLINEQKKQDYVRNISDVAND